MKQIKKTLITAASVFALTLPVGTQAEELRHAFGLTGQNALRDATDRWAGYVEKHTDGETRIKIFYGSLFNLAETFSGLRDGVVDSGYVVPAYHRAELPYANLLSDMGTAGSDPIAMAGAANDYIFNCAACLKEYNDQGQVFLGAAVIGTYYMYSRDPIRSLADFKGRKIRGFGPFGRWVNAVGASAVVISATQIYESMSQGHIDGNTHNLETLEVLSLGEVANYVLEQPIGLFPGNSMFNVNLSTWAGLSAKTRRAMLDGAAMALAIPTVDGVKQSKAILADPKSYGVEVLQPSDDVKATTEAFRVSDMDTVVKLNRDQYGLADADRHVATFLSLLKKWDELVKTVDTSDPVAVGELYRREVFSNVDPDSLT